MDFLTFEDLQARFQELYHDQAYQEALELVTENSESFPEYSHLLYYWRISLAARLGDSEQAIALLNDVLQTGFWYGEVLLRKSPSLKSLQGDTAFEHLVEMNRLLQEKDPEQKYPLLLLRSQGRCQAGGPACPAMIALHTNAGSAQDSVEFWQPVASQGWLVGVPQSSQAMWKGAYIWDNYEIAESEVRKAFESMTEKYAVDRQRVILAGHSMGGETAMRLALEGGIGTLGFIAVGPAGPFMDDLDRWLPAIHAGQNLGLRGYLLAGEEDESIEHENIQALFEMFNQNGVICELEEIPLAGHEYSPEYESAMLRALEFVDQK
jgi:predicted esterase